MKVIAWNITLVKYNGDTLRAQPGYYDKGTYPSLRRPQNSMFIYLVWSGHGRNVFKLE